MTLDPPKERKFVECFKSNRDGSCNYCKTRTWNTGNKIYAMKMPDGKWLACTDKKCYLEQGGKLTLFHDNPLPVVIGKTVELDNNINEEVEPFKMIAYAMKDLAHEQKNVNIKILRALRNHEKRMTRIEKHLHITIRQKEMVD